MLTVSGAQQRDSSIHIHVPLSPKLPSALGKVSCQVLNAGIFLVLSCNGFLTYFRHQIAIRYVRKCLVFLPFCGPPSHCALDCVSLMTADVGRSSSHVCCVNGPFGDMSTRSLIACLSLLLTTATAGDIFLD